MTTARGFHYHDGTLTPREFTPSERKHHRGTGNGFMLTGREDTIHRCLARYFQEEQ